MKYSTLVLTIVCLLASSAWAISEPKCMLNKSQAAQADAAATGQPTEVLPDPFQKDNDDDDDYGIISLSWDADLQEAVSLVLWPFKYLGAKLKEGFTRFQSNIKVLRELHRRRKQNTHARLRRIRKSKRPPRLILPRKTRPRSVRWIPEATLRAYFGNNFSSQALYHSLELEIIPYYFAEQHLLMANASIVAMR